MINIKDNFAPFVFGTIVIGLFAFPFWSHFNQAEQIKTIEGIQIQGQPVGGITRTVIGVQTRWLTDLIPSSGFSPDLGSATLPVQDLFTVNASISGRFTINGGSYTFPTDDGLLNEFLLTDGTGSLSWDKTQGRLSNNGAFRESFKALASMSATVSDITLEKEGGGDLVMQFSTGDFTLDCTPKCEIALTNGSGSSPTTNYVYIPIATKVLTKNTSDWPATEHIKVAFFLVQTAASASDAGGFYINQNWNNALLDGDNSGHAIHIAERVRRDSAQYFSGIDGSGTDEYLSPSGTTVDLKTTSGEVYQLHKHTFAAFDTSSGGTSHVKNWFGDAFHPTTNLFDIVADSGGNTIGANKWFNIVIWGVMNESGEHETIMINLPSGFYNTQVDAENDVMGFDDFTMPREFTLDSSTGFLIARITVKKATPWIVGATLDLRGQTPTTARGGASGAIQDFADNAFSVFNVTNSTRIGVFDIQNVTDGNTRTITWPNRDLDLDSPLFSFASIALNLEVAGEASASKTFGSGLNVMGGTTGCTNATDDKVLYNDSTGKFSCGTDADSGGTSGNNNEVLTDDGSGGLVSEGNFKFDGSLLTITGYASISADFEVIGTASISQLFLATALADAYVAEDLTLTSGTINAMSIGSAVLWTTTGTLTIGDGGDRVDFATGTWDVADGIFSGLAGMTGTGDWDLGGAELEIPNGSSFTFDTLGEFFFDTTDFQIQIATASADTPRVIPTMQKLWSFAIASTSNEFFNGGRIPLAIQRDKYNLSEIHCGTDVSGTSVVVNISNMTGTYDTESITADFDGQADTSIDTNSNYSGFALPSSSLEFGSITGSPNWLTCSIYGLYVPK